MKFVIDIDGVICDEEKSVFERKPYKKRIDYINKLYDEGHEIVYFTARGMRSQNDDQYRSDQVYRMATEHQLNDWNCKYHALFFGKPNADVYIDNKNLMMDEFFDE